MVRGGQEFDEMLNQLGVDSIDIVLAISEASSEKFRQGLVPLAAFSPTQAEAWPAKIAKFADKLDYLFEIVRATEPRAVVENERELREELHLGSRKAPTAACSARAQITVPRGARGRDQTKATRPAPVDAEGIPSLKKVEAEAKECWVRRLAAIVDRAGDAASIIADLVPVAEMTVMNVTELQHAMLGRGAWATIRCHVLTWERFEKWAAHREVYPPSWAILLAYAAELGRTCGPAVLPAFRATVAWVGRRIGLTVPDLAAPAFLAIEDSVYERAGKELREAVPLDVHFLKSLEHCIIGWAQDSEHCRVVRAWQTLCMTWGSMRFDDALHVRPDSVRVDGAALRCTAWKTKTERKGRGTKFAVCKASFSDFDWVAAGLESYRKVVPEWAAKSDFWLVSGSVDMLDFQAPLSRQSFADILGELAGLVCEKNPLALEDETLEELRRVTESASAHSPRVTMVSMMAHAGADTLTLQMQGNWKDTRMPEKYTRDRKSIPLGFISKMVHTMKKDIAVGVGSMDIEDVTEEKAVAAGIGVVDRNDVINEPQNKHRRTDAPNNEGVDIGANKDEAVPETAEEQADEANYEADLTELCFWVSAKAEVLPNSDYRFHVISLDRPGQLACNNIPLANCVPLGFEWPERGKLCNSCIARRPDAALAGPDSVM